MSLAASTFLAVSASAVGCGEVVVIDPATSTTATSGTGGASPTSSSTSNGGAGGVGPACVSEDDGNACTEDLCENDIPVNKPLPAGAPCSKTGAICDGMGTCVGCLAPSDCPGVDDACATRTCAGGACGIAFNPLGTPVPAQTAGDCSLQACDGEGAVVALIDDSDLPDDSNGCTDDICSAGAPQNLQAPPGTSCGDGLVCDAIGQCVGCAAPGDCPGGDDACGQRTCTAGVCGVVFAPANTPIATQTANDCLLATCDGNGAITSTPDAADLPLDDGDPCTDEVCNAGSPGHPTKANGASCDDGDPCTQGSTCQAGTCAAGSPLACAPQNPCQLPGACNPLTGACENPTLPDGSFCNDNLACTNSFCQAGVCASSPFGAYLPYLPYFTGSVLQQTVIADVTGDGLLDLVSVGTDLSVLRNVVNSTFDAHVNYPTGPAPRALTVADFNGDGALDVAVASYLGDAASVLLNNGNGTFGASVDYAVGAGPTGIAAADFNGDGTPDLAVTNGGPGDIGTTVSVLLNNGNGTFAAKVDYGTGQGPLSVAAADLDGDGKPDLAVANFTSNDVSVLLNNGNGTFAAKVDHPAGVGAGSVVAADLDGDGKRDLAVANRTANTVSVLLNNGNGTFAAKVDLGTGGAPWAVTATDLNGDGTIDLAVANNSDITVSVLRGNGNGTFLAKLDYLTRSEPRSIAAADLDGDGDVDLAVGASRLAVHRSTGCP